MPQPRRVRTLRAGRRIPPRFLAPALRRLDPRRASGTPSGRARREIGRGGPRGSYATIAPVSKRRDRACWRCRTHRAAHVISRCHRRRPCRRGCGRGAHAASSTTLQRRRQSSFIARSVSMACFPTRKQQTPLKPRVREPPAANAPTLFRAPESTGRGLLLLPLGLWRGRGPQDASTFTRERCRPQRVTPASSARFLTSGLMYGSTIFARSNASSSGVVIGFSRNSWTLAR